MTEHVTSRENGPPGEPVALTARDVMTSSLLTVNADDGLLLTWELVTQAGVHRVPVLDNGCCVGLVEVTTIAMECVREPLGHQRRLIRELVQGYAVQVAADTPLDAVADELLTSGSSAVLVHDADSRLVGMITVHDLLRALAGRVQPQSAGQLVSTDPVLFRLTPVLPCVIARPGG